MSDGDSRRIGGKLDQLAGARFGERIGLAAFRRLLLTFAIHQRHVVVEALNVVVAVQRRAVAHGARIVRHVDRRRNTR